MGQNPKAGEQDPGERQIKLANATALFDMAVQQCQPPSITRPLKQQIDDLQAEEEEAAGKPLYKTLSEVEASLTKQDEYWTKAEEKMKSEGEALSKALAKAEANLKGHVAYMRETETNHFATKT